MTSRTGGCTPPQPLAQLLAMKRGGAAGGKSARGEPSDGPPLNSGEVGGYGRRRRSIHVWQACRRRRRHPRAHAVRRQRR
jgi:hypothetical protein